MADDSSIARVVRWAEDRSGAWLDRRVARLHATVLVGGRPGRATLMLFEGGARWPTVVVKMIASGADPHHLVSEFAALREAATGLEPSMAATVPRALELRVDADLTALATTPIRGLRAEVPNLVTPRLGRRQERQLARHVVAVRTWSQELAAATRGTGIGEDQRYLVSRVHRFLELADIDGSADERFRSFAAAAGACDISWIPAWQHGDVAPGNVLYDGRRVRLVDWEAASSHHLPWRDDCYLLLSFARNAQAMLGAPTVGIGMRRALGSTSEGGSLLRKLYAETWRHPLPLGWALLTIVIEHALGAEAEARTLPAWTALAIDLVADPDLRHACDWAVPRWVNATR